MKVVIVWEDIEIDDFCVIKINLVMEDICNNFLLNRINNDGEDIKVVNFFWKLYDMIFLEMVDLKDWFFD